MCRQVGLQPLVFSRAACAAPYIPTVGVQGDDVPGAHIEAVIALAWGAGGSPKILEVACGAFVGDIASRPARGEVFVVAYRWVGDGLDAAPAQVIGLQVGLV